MKINFKFIFKVLGWVMFVFLLLSFIIALVKLPPYFNIKFNLSNMSVKSNVSFSQIKGYVFDYYKVLFTSGFGKTSTNKDVWDYIKPGLLKTAALLIGSIIISIVLGIIKGIFDSKKDKNRASNIKLLSSLTLMSMPDIFVIIVIQSIIIWLFKRGIQILPAYGSDTIKHTILPMIALSVIPTIYVARITTLSVDEIYNQEYIRTALGKGASRFRIMWVHVLRNAIVEIAGSFSSIATILISSLLVVEYMFHYIGLTYIMHSNLNREPHIVLAIAIIIGITYFVIDILFKGVKFVLSPKRRESEV